MMSKKKHRTPTVKIPYTKKNKFSTRSAGTRKNPLLGAERDGTGIRSES